MCSLILSSRRKEKAEFLSTASKEAMKLNMAPAQEPNPLTSQIHKAFWLRQKPQILPQKMRD